MVSSPPKLRAIDVGSFPLDADMSRYIDGARQIERDPGAETQNALYFIEKHNEAFRKKAEAMGPEISVTSFAQCRGMIEQYLDPLFVVVTGMEDAASNELVTKSNAQMVAAEIAMGKVSMDSLPSRIAEVIALERGAEELSMSLGVGEISYKACVTGPLELMLNLQRIAGFPRGYDEKLMDFFTDIVTRYVRGAAVSSKHLKLEVVTMDDPSFGLESLGDFFTDTKNDESLNHMISCWDRIYSQVPAGCYGGLHLHTSPFEQLFAADWNLLEAHVGVYVEPDWPAEFDKYIRAAIMRTDGPAFSSGVDLKAAWDEIRGGSFQKYLQPASAMKRYLDETLQRYGSDRVPFAGPECGIGPWDWNHGAEMALSNLETVRNVVTS
ncbi:MAG: hypothetical protein ACXADF_17525 [Candidatus Thorarchaeota archaeon]|jgi:hypothetical protein